MKFLFTVNFFRTEPKDFILKTLKSTLNMFEQWFPRWLINLRFFSFHRFIYTMPPVMYSIPCRPFFRSPLCPRVWSRLAPSVWPGLSSFPSVPAVCGRPGCLCGIPQPCLTLGPGGNIVQYWAIVTASSQVHLPSYYRAFKDLSHCDIEISTMQNKTLTRQWLCVTDTHLIYIGIDY